MNILNDWNDWKSIIEDDGVTICHSAQNEITVYSVSDYYDADETSCEEDWANFQGVCTVTVEDVLTGNVNLSDYELTECLESFINGQFRQAENQFNELDCQSDFIDFISGDVLELDILKSIVNFYI